MTKEHPFNSREYQEKRALFLDAMERQIINKSLSPEERLGAYLLRDLVDAVKFNLDRYESEIAGEDRDECMSRAIDTILPFAFVNGMASYLAAATHKTNLSAVLLSIMMSGIEEIPASVKEAQRSKAEFIKAMATAN